MVMQTVFLNIIKDSRCEDINTILEIMGIWRIDRQKRVLPTNKVDKYVGNMYNVLKYDFSCELFYGEKLI